MGWGISPEAEPKEKLKAEMGDYLNGLNSTGDLDYDTYSELFDFSMELLDKMHRLGSKEKGKQESEKKEDYFYVMKKGNKYFEDVWEECEDDINYTFTDNLSRAMTFSEYRLTSDVGAPKYLWDDKQEKIVKSIKDMCKMFDGRMVKIVKRTEWAEV